MVFSCLVAINLFVQLTSHHLKYRKEGFFSGESRIVRISVLSDSKNKSYLEIASRSEQ